MTDGVRVLALSSHGACSHTPRERARPRPFSWWSLAERVTILSIAGLAICATIGAQEPRASIDVAVGSAGLTRVTERFLVAPDSGALTLRVLSRPCAQLGALHVSRAGVSRAIVLTRRGPWLEYRDTLTEGAPARLAVDVSYDVQLTGTTSDVPLVHPAHPLPQREGVDLTVRGAITTFPHLARSGPLTSSARFVAVPAFVHLADVPSPPTQSCVGADDTSLDGGLTWRFWTLVAIMAVWVPLYLAWARRQGEGRE